MKKLLALCAVAVLTVSTAFSQTYDSGFLDGTIMFQLKEAPQSENVYQNDPNDFALDVSLNDYPELKAIFSGVTVTEINRPSYFTRNAQLANIFRVKFSDFDQIEELIEALQGLENVEYAEREPIYTFNFIPNDTFHSGNNKWYHTLVDSEDAWDISQGSNNVKVAIVDNAVFGGHQDLTTYLERDVADNDNNATPPLDANADFGWSHGTHCAGLATADINNNLGIASIGGNVELIGIKATPNSATSSGSIWYGYDGVQWACQNGANVVSMSYGSPSSSAAMQNLINAYPNVVFLAAAGNDGNTTQQYPGAYDNVICVGSVNSNDSKSNFSNYNGGGTPWVDIAAPGGYSFGGLLSTVYTTGGNNYAQSGGTSMATPFAAGLVGLMLSVNPTMTPAQIESCLLSSGVAINQDIGPRIDALAAIQCVQSTLTGDPLPFFSGTPLSVTEGDFVNFTDLSADGGNPISNWTWSFPGGTPNSFVGQTPPPIQYNTAGQYDVTLSVTNSLSTQSATQTAYINVSVPPYGEWLNQSSGFTAASRGINYISIADANTVWATAYDGSGGAANIQEFTKTVDGGLTWTPGNINIGNTGLGVSMITAFDANTAWLAAYPTAGGQTGGIWKTTDGGTTWNRQNTATYNNAASFTNVVYFWDANVGFCQGDPINGEFELYTTTNGGTTWVPVPGANIPNPTNGNEFGYTRQIDISGDHVWFTTSLGRVYHSSDKGLTWDVFTTPIADFGGAVTAGSSANLSFADPNNGLIIDNAGDLYKTTDGGATWNLTTTAGPVFTNGLCYIENTNTAFSTGAGTAGGSSYSTDGGVTWTSIDTEDHLFVEFTNPSVGWSGWFNQNATTDGMWKWNDLSSSMVPDFSASVATTCINTNVTYTDMTTGSTPTSWLWSFPGGTPSTSTAQNPTVQYAAAGTYDATLTVSDGTSQTTYTQTAIVDAIGPAAVPGSISGALSLCENEVEVYSVTNDPAVVYNWTLPAGWTGTSTTNSISVTAGTNAGTIEVTAENICGVSAASTINVDIFAGAPTAAFNETNAGATFDFTSTSTDATSWSWDFGDGGSSTQENPSHTYTQNGTFTVTLIVSNGCGSDTTTLQVDVTGVGLEDLTFDDVNVYPIPVNDLLSIEVTSGLLDREMTITNVFGQEVTKTALNDLKIQVETVNFAAGMYFITIDGIAGSYRFIKE
ncbi:MAG: hypothetical protein Crog4KO_27200 [Crocinitomicaceae bacterium]